MRGDAPEQTMFASEAAFVAGAAAFAAPRVRDGAAAAPELPSGRIGVAGLPIRPDSDRVPQWPAGVVGSMTHCEGYRAAAVARSDELTGIGIDAEPHRPLPVDALELVLRDDERAVPAEARRGAAHDELGPDRVLRQGGDLQSLVPADSALA